MLCMMIKTHLYTQKIQTQNHINSVRNLMLIPKIKIYNEHSKNKLHLPPFIYRRRRKKHVYPAEINFVPLLNFHATLTSDIFYFHNL